MKQTFLTSRLAKLLCASSFTIVLGLNATTVHSVCNYEALVGDCKLSAELTSVGLEIVTDGASCATVDYQVNGSVKRMFIDQQSGIDSSVTSASSGVQIISCKSYSNSIVPTTPSVISQTAPTQVTPTQVPQTLGQFPVQPAGTVVYPAPLPQSGQ